MLIRCALLLCAASVVGCVAQNFELGGAAGYGYCRNRTITQGSSTADVGFRRGLSFSAVAGNDMHRLVGGEVRYSRRENDLLVSSGGTNVTMDGEAHIVHYDALVHASSPDAHIRPFIAFGGGIKYYRGTGTEREFQPLGRFAILTRTNELLPMLSLGGGVKLRIARHAILRFDFRDYMTPFPSKILLPGPGARVGGWLHDLTGMVGISAYF